MQSTQTLLASRWSRLVSSFIDGFILSMILFPLLYLLVSGNLEAAQHLNPIQKLIIAVAGWVVFLAINGYLLAKRGQTVGKMVMKIRIVDLEGNIPSLIKILLLRYFAVGLISQLPVIGSLFSLINLLIIFGPERRCLHDYIAGTRVVSTEEVYYD